MPVFPAASRAVGAKVTNSAVAATASGVATTLGTGGTGTNVACWDTVARDDASFWSSGAASRLTVPAGLDGWYSIVAGIGWGANATGYRRVFFFKNGTIVLPGDQRPATATLGTSHSLVMPDYLVATDYIEVQVVQLSGGSLNVAAASFFALVRL